MVKTLTWGTSSDWDNAQRESGVQHPSGQLELLRVFHDDAEDGDASEYSETGNSGSAGVVQESAPDGGSYSLYVDQNNGGGETYEMYSDSTFDWNTTYRMKALVKSDNFDSSDFLGTHIGWRGRHGDADTISVTLFSTDSSAVEQPIQFGGGGVTNATTHSIDWVSSSWLWVEVLVDETNGTAEGKAWYDGNSEPSNWQFSADITTGITNEEVHLFSNGTSSVNLDLDVAFLTFRSTDGSLATAKKVT